jgi:ABC-2 type transport system permease protein
MKRYIKIYKRILELNFSSLVIYRGNLVNNIVSSIAWATFSFISIYLLTSKSPSAFGWRREEIIALTAVFGIVIGLFHTLFTKNFEKLSFDILYGKLDSVFCKPIDSQFLCSCTMVGYSSLVRVIMGIVVLVYILPSLSITIGVFEIVGAFLTIIIGILLLYSIWLICTTILFWNPRLTNIIEVLYTVSGLMRYPKEMYQRVSQELFYLVFPLTFLAVTPAKILLKTSSLYDIIGLLVCAGILLLTSRLLWKYALRFYTSASN